MGYGLGLAGTWERARTVPALVGKWDGKESNYFQTDNLSFQQLLCVYQDKHLSIVSTPTSIYIYSTYTDLGHQIMKSTAASPQVLYLICEYPKLSQTLLFIAAIIG